MNLPLERIKLIYRHLLADLVSYLEYHLINNKKNNNNKTNYKVEH